MKIYTAQHHRVLKIETGAYLMETLVCAFEIMLTVALCVLFPTRAHAEQIMHHGITVESEGTAKDCLSCHDESLAGAVTFCTVKCNGLSSHSILKEYPPTKNRDLYASADMVAAQGIKIVSGKMTCISCHKLKNPRKFHLAVEQPQLCIICHIGWYQR